ncbi:MAG TPA: UDP-N-acetylmuramate dehydrogenase [Kofleriaceae bacterium]|nr:UDP-N-acetylmuramate dehydrogenase [Kofleriaceae bacterium]
MAAILARARSMLSEADRRAVAVAAGEDGARFDEPLARHTTLKIGGPADALVLPATVEALSRVLAVCGARGLPVRSVGGGSNLLCRDGGVRGVVVSTRRLRGLEIREHELFVEAGVSTGKVLAVATANELGGVEFLGGVPGSVGGGLIMNAGTTLGEFKDVTDRVRSLRIADGSDVVRDNTGCAFVYRGSALPADEIVVSAVLRLRPRRRAEISADVRALRERRAQREPKGVHNAGSMFKNPAGDFAGRIIEAAGLKGTRVGGAECSPVHANWLVNTGGASAADLLALIDLVRHRVHQTFGITLELEVKIIGED